jgi:hypothetical protein
MVLDLERLEFSPDWRHLWRFEPSTASPLEHGPAAETEQEVYEAERQNQDEQKCPDFQDGRREAECFAGQLAKPPDDPGANADNKKHQESMH